PSDLGPKGIILEPKSNSSVDLLAKPIGDTSTGVSTTGRVRSRFGRFGSKHAVGIPALEPLLRAVRANHPKADVSLIERAYTTAELAHRGQLRKSGDPYITHPVAVAT